MSEALFHDTELMVAGKHGWEKVDLGEWQVPPPPRTPSPVVRHWSELDNTTFVRSSGPTKEDERAFLASRAAAEAAASQEGAIASNDPAMNQNEAAEDPKEEAATSTKKRNRSNKANGLPRKKPNQTTT